jgi:nucleoside-diphosphate-sugar epimerase
MLEESDLREKRVGVLGATSLVGQCLVQLLVENGWQVKAFSRRPVNNSTPGVEWAEPVQASSFCGNATRGSSPIIPFWICAAPIWVLPDYLPMLEAHGAGRVIAISSTSRFTKSDSSSPEEVEVARKLTRGEDLLCAWAQSKGIDWVIFRPTLIYGLAQDRNISEIVHLVRHLGFFPLAGHAQGMRQPVHAEDVAGICMAALVKPGAIRRSYNLSGGETLSYREMISRIFKALGRSPRLVELPLWLFQLAIFLIRFLPRYRHWNLQMAERMNINLVFDHAEATRDFHYFPRPFQPASKDLSS